MGNNLNRLVGPAEQVRLQLRMGIAGLGQNRTTLYQRRAKNELFQSGSVSLLYIPSGSKKYATLL